MLAETIAKYDRNHVILYTGIMFVGIILWDLIMASLASVFRRFLTPRGLSVISIVSGLSLIGFGYGQLVRMESGDGTRCMLLPFEAQPQSHKANQYDE